MEKLAIISVFDKTNLEEFAQGLKSLGYSILSTGGTAKFLKERGVEVISISDYTQHPEILEGRVKSLHPKIHGGILVRRDLDADLKELELNGISPIDIVVVNLYPFSQKAKKTECQGIVEHDSLVEDIDIGGPTMIRAAAKNCRFVLPVCDPQDYPMILEQLRSQDEIPQETRRKLAAKVFSMMSAYDGSIARYFSLNEHLLDDSGKVQVLAPIESMTLVQQCKLRYGENPHQSAALYNRIDFGELNNRRWQQLQGKELSYNNLMDMYAALDLFLDVFAPTTKKHSAVIIKHSNPCGVAIRDTPLDAFIAARDCDPQSAFGGIVAVSGMVNRAEAEAICEGFVEVLLVEDISEAALSVFAQKKNLRLLKCDFNSYQEIKSGRELIVKSFFGEYLMQTNDAQLRNPNDWQLVAGEMPSQSVIDDCLLAWKVCKHVKSNAIVIVKDQKAIGVGAGQMNRVDSARIAVQRAINHGHNVIEAVSASDAFLPFPDTLEVLSDAGIRILIQPGGSIKDELVVETAKERGVTMLFTGERHFRH